MSSRSVLTSTTTSGITPGAAPKCGVRGGSVRYRRSGRFDQQSRKLGLFELSRTVGPFSVKRREKRIETIRSLYKKQRIGKDVLSAIVCLTNSSWNGFFHSIKEKFFSYLPLTEVSKHAGTHVLSAADAVLSRLSKVEKRRQRRALQKERKKASKKPSRIPLGIKKGIFSEDPDKVPLVKNPVTGNLDFGPDHPVSLARKRLSEESNRPEARAKREEVNRQWAAIFEPIMFSKNIPREVRNDLLRFAEREPVELRDQALDFGVIPKYVEYVQRFFSKPETEANRFMFVTHEQFSRSMWDFAYHDFAMVVFSVLEEDVRQPSHWLSKIGFYDLSKIPWKSTKFGRIKSYV